MDYIIDSINAIDVNGINSVYKLLLSLLLGCCVGLERKRKGQIAGLRTFALISMGATLAMILSIYVPQEYLGLKNGDPGRIAAQVITGIGFLGAGAIIQSKGSVRGLTTAASIWIVATIGMAVGVGMYTLSIIATLLIILVLAGIEGLERHIHLGGESRIIRIRVDSVVTDIEPYDKVLWKHNVKLVNTYVDYNFAQKTTSLNLVVLARETTNFISLFSDLRHLHPTSSISIAKELTI
ncbi:MAG: MgtC/SapB family protein [Firmicutes bacterium]|nr:MgtC/SapB family protein [Bacillota bacterium]MCM1401304.1 MgtC/SapB family protein [Bacteroides sp.]MCM1476741.1 MgtC/SapB family protein [Bacteroides sp.]